MYISDNNFCILEAPYKITDNIFQGNSFCSEYENNLIDLGITNILVVGSTLVEHFPKSFCYLKINLLDNEYEDAYKYFELAYSFIENCINNNGKILIHCMAGISRSTTFVIVYFIKKYKYSYDKSIEIIKKVNKFASPNKGYVAQLKKLEKLYISNL